MCVRYNEGVRCSEVSVNGGSTVLLLQAYSMQGYINEWKGTYITRNICENDDTVTECPHC